MTEAVTCCEAAQPCRQKQIATLNDQLRRTFIGGRVVVTPGVANLEAVVYGRLLQAVRQFDAFDGNNDPHGEHDCAIVEDGGHALMFKIDYYDTNLEFGSDDPADPKVTTRVMTLMLPDEY